MGRNDISPLCIVVSQFASGFTVATEGAVCIDLQVTVSEGHGIGIGAKGLVEHHGFGLLVHIVGQLTRGDVGSGQLCNHGLRLVFSIAQIDHVLP